MKTGSLHTAAALLLCAAIAAASACGTKSPAAETTASQTTTTAAETTTTTAAPAVTAAPETEPTATDTEETDAPATEETTAPEPVYENDGTYDSDRAKHPFRLGVWLMQNEERGEYYDETYIRFYEGGGGSTRSQEMGIGLPFSYETDSDDPMKITFTMGAADNFVHLDILDSNEDGSVVRVKWGNVGTVEKWTYLCSDTDFAFYSTESLRLMAEHYYKRTSGTDAQIATDWEVREDGLIGIHIFDPAVPGEASTLAWYFVNRFTGGGEDRDGNYVNLTENPDNWVEMPEMETFAPTISIEQRSELIDSGMLLGVWYLGYVDPAYNNFENFRVSYDTIFEATGMYEKIPYLYSLSADRFVCTESGQELYLLLTASKNAEITVLGASLDPDTAALTAGGELFTSNYNAAPILLKCNAGEIVPDVIIRLTDSDGSTLEWSPCISGRDGTVEIDYGSPAGRSIRDFTDYGALAGPDTVQAVG